MTGWIGVDLDGTLAHYDGWKDEFVGKPVQAMVERVQKWLQEGRDVRIFTARVTVANKDSLARQYTIIEDWCQQFIGRVLPITATKDLHMIMLYDDRCTQVELNTGRLVGDVK